MRHCCKFRADDIYYLADTEIYTNRKLSIGFCPICNKPVAELTSVRFDDFIENIKYTGLQADSILYRLKDEILYSLRECNYSKLKSKPYGWKYGVNKNVKKNGKDCIKQYAYDFYGNKEIVKEIK